MKCHYQLNIIQNCKTTDDLADGKWQMIPGDGLDNFNDQLRHGKIGKIKLKETETGEQ